MNIVYASCTCSKNKYESLFVNSECKPGQQVQKYNRLLIEGLSKNKGVDVNTVSCLPITRQNTKKILLPLCSEVEGNIKYNYIPMINVPLIKNFFVFICSFLLTLRLCKIKKEDTVIICDILNISVAFGAVLAAKLSRKKSVGIVTDIPAMIYGEKSLNTKISMWLLYSFSSYVFLTKEMNKLVNRHNRPYVVLEGHVDINMQDIHNTLTEKYAEKVCIYAGGLNRIYGIDYLVNGFLKANIENSILHIYGTGDYEQEVKKICSQTDKVKYFGVVSNDLVVSEQLKATLLINPRPTTEEYTKYSFPSKNMEYMLSGTPTLTTKLPGMPQEYDEFVYLIQEENECGLARVLTEILNLDTGILHLKGANAKEFVLKNKNNVLQAKKILDMLNYKI